MEKHFGKVGMVRESLLAKPQYDHLRPDSVTPAVQKDLHLNLERVSVYSPGNDQQSPGSESSQYSNASHTTVPQPPAAPSTAHDAVSSKTARLTLQPVYAAIAVVALFNLAFIGWVLFELSDLSKVAASTQKAEPFTALQQRLSVHDSSIDTLQFAVSAIRSELLSLDSRINQSTNDAAGILAVDQVQARDRVETVEAGGDFKKAAETHTKIEKKEIKKKNTVDIKTMVAAGEEGPTIDIPEASVGNKLALKKSAQNGAVNSRLAPKKALATPAQELVHKANEKPLTKRIWLVNLGTFSSEEAAESMRKNVSALGYSVRIVRTKSDKKPVLKVQLGDFSSWKSAQSIVDQLEMKTGITGLWVSRLN